MGISLGFDLTPKLLDVLASFIPSLPHVRSVRIEAAAVGSMIVGFRIAVMGKPRLDGSSSYSDATGNLFDFHPLLEPRNHLEVAIIALSLVCRVRLSVGSQKRAVVSLRM